jgi:S1-C subfamily serine protease
MKKLLSCFFVVCLFVCTSAFAITTENVKKARDATVLVAQPGSGFGSGVVISPDGLVITNYHVIHRAEKLRVYFYDPKDLNYYLADVIGIDPVADLAVIKINVPDDMLPLTYLKLGLDYEIAEEVVAIGHPLGLQWSVTKGIINHLKRPGKITPYVNIIQHTAEINKGNSGGPLINSDGDIVGINTYILAPQGEWTGVAYAIRSDTVYNSVEQIKEFGEVTYSAMKLGVRDMNEYFINAVVKENPDRKFPTNIYGLMATQVEKEDYAHKQGIRNFDVIVAINGNPINYLGDLRDLMKDFEPNEVVKLLYIRNGHFKKLDYTIGTLDFDVYLEWYDGAEKKQVEKESPNPNKPD